MIVFKSKPWRTAGALKRATGRRYRIKSVLMAVLLVELAVLAGQAFELIRYQSREERFELVLPLGQPAADGQKQSGIAIDFKNWTIEFYQKQEQTVLDEAVDN